MALTRGWLSSKVNVFENLQRQEPSPLSHHLLLCSSPLLPLLDASYLIKGSGLLITLHPLASGHIYSRLSPESKIRDLENRACPSLTLYINMRPEWQRFLDLKIVYYALLSLL